MRFIFGIIVGCLLTVGAAYVHDASIANGPDTVATDAGGAATADGRMVNWSVVDRNMRGVNGWVQSQWAWISTRFNHAG